MAVTKNGMFVTVWPLDQERGLGKVVFVPFGKVLILDAATVHAGAFKICGSDTERIQMYISRHGRAIWPEGNCWVDKAGDPLEDRYSHDEEVIDKLKEIGVLE